MELVFATTTTSFSSHDFRLITSTRNIEALALVGGHFLISADAAIAHSYGAR